MVGNFVILHLGRPEQAVAEFARVLAPGGTLALTTYLPERARLLGLFLDAVTEAGAAAPAGLPDGPDIFRFADDAEFDHLLGEAGLEDPAISTISFTHRVATADELWDGFLGGSLRAAALIEHQPAETRRRIRSAFDRLVEEHRSEDGIDVPVSAKLASARKPG